MRTVTETALARTAALLREAADLHHRVYRITDGADEDWASWYADWLATLSELPEVLDTHVIRSELVALLIELDQATDADSGDGDWADVYAAGIVARHAG
jgi:hypothetical protein